MWGKGCVVPPEQGPTLVRLSQTPPATDAVPGKGQAMARLQEVKCRVGGPDKQDLKSQQALAIPQTA